MCHFLRVCSPARAPQPRSNACPLFSDQFSYSPIFALSSFSSNEMNVCLGGLASCLPLCSFSPVPEQSRAHTWRRSPEASAHFKHFLNPSLSLFLPSEDGAFPPSLPPSLRRQTPNLPIHATSSSSARLKAPTQPAAATTPSAMAGASGAACDGGGGVRPFFEISSWQNRFPRRFVRNFVRRNVRPFQMTREDHILEDETYIL